MVSLFYNSQLLETTFTTADGNFYFARQIPGFYDLTFSSTDNKFKSVNYAIRLLDDGITQPEAPVVNLELTNPGTAPVNAKIEGEIIDSDTGEKLSNINIELVKADGTLHSTALTNANGYFYFDNLTSAEVYTIKAGKASNYTEEQQNVTIRNDNVVSPRYLIMRLGTKPIEKFTITGAVKTPENQAIINAEVKIFDDIDLTIPSAQATRTTGDGTFVFENLNEPRIYYIKVSETDLSETSQIFPVRILSNGTTSPESAEIFVTKKDRIKTFDISGKIYDVFSGGPLEYADVEIENNGIALTDVNGSFIIKNLVAGNYNVKISKFGYETTAASFHLLDDGTTKPETLAFSMLHSLKKGYGSIAGRYIDIDSGTGVTGLYIRLFKWQLTTKVDNVVDRIVDGNIFYKTISETDDQYVDSVLLTSKSSSPSDPDFIPEYAGSFKLTHLEPGKYLVYITTSSTVPNSTNEARGGYFTWKVPDKDSDPGFKTEIRNLEVLDGQTTYWTNYEQEYK
jgi:hypothetical protein